MTQRWFSQSTCAQVRLRISPGRAEAYRKAISTRRKQKSDDCRSNAWNSSSVITRCLPSVWSKGILSKGFLAGSSSFLMAQFQHRLTEMTA
jgi:hypothetical protein